MPTVRGLAAVSILCVAAITATVAWMRSLENRFTSHTTSPLRPTTDMEQGFLPPRVARRYSSILWSQQKLDESNIAYSPDLDSLSIKWPNGILRLSSSFSYRGHETVIFAVFHNDNILVKFQANCDNVENPGSIHPLIRDYFFGREAGKLGIAPRPLFVSPPVRFRRSFITNQFRMKANEFDECIRDGGTVRFLVVEKLSTFRDLYTLQAATLPEGVISLQNATTIASNLVHALGRLHLEAFVIHGDIHPGNILVDMRNLNVKLIDFGRSRTNTRKFSQEPVFREYKLCHEAYSHWQMEGYEWSMRDDVYNGLRAIAFAMNDVTYRNFESAIHSQRDSLIEWRKNGFIFSFNTSDPISKLHISETSRKSIRDSFGRILDLVRKLGINDIPEYSLIGEELRFCTNTSLLASDCASHVSSV